MPSAGGAFLFAILWIVLVLVCGGLWMFFAIRGLIRMANGTGGTWASAMAQLSVVAMLIGLLRFGPTWGIGIVLFPPVLLVFVSDIAALSITGQIALYAVPLTAVVLALTLTRAPLRPFSITLTSATLLVATLIVGEVISANAMCRTATEQGLTNVTRNSFRWSVSNIGNDYEYFLHGLALRGEDRVAWSYAEMDWYDVPDIVWPDVTSGDPACGA